MLKKIKTAKTFLQVTTFLCMALCFAQVSRGEINKHIERVFSMQAIETQDTKKKMKQFQAGWIEKSTQQELRIDLTDVSVDLVKGKIYSGSSQQVFSVPMKVSKVPHDYQYKAVLAISKLKSQAGLYTLFFDLNHPDELRIIQYDQKGDSVYLKLFRTEIKK